MKRLSKVELDKIALSLLNTADRLEAWRVMNRSKRTKASRADELRRVKAWRDLAAKIEEMAQDEGRRVLAIKAKARKKTYTRKKEAR